MKITVITAVTRVDGLRNVIRSLENQTCQEWEHIIINDNREEVRNVMKDFCYDERRHWIDLGVKTGYYGAFARNIGVMASFSYFSERSRKEDRDYWIMFLDDDNEWYPDFMEKVYNCHMLYPNTTMIGKDIEIRGKKDGNYRKLLKNQLCSQNTDIGAWAYKKSLFDKYGYFPADLEHKNTFDWALIKKISDNEPEGNIMIIEGNPGLIFYHKKH